MSTSSAPSAVRLAPGDAAPDWTLPDADGTSVSLADYRGRSLVLYFYPAAGTPGCTKQAKDFRDHLDAFDTAGHAVVGISPDTPAKLAKFRDAEALTFPLLSDVDKKVLAAYGAYGEKTMYGKKVTGVIRSTLLIDPEGKVTEARYGVRATGHVEKLRRDLGF
jgi:peroxiredoxin Q/BCP